MGYATRDVNAGFSVKAPTFIDIGATANDIDLQNLSLIDSEGWGADQIQVLGTDGVVTDDVYYWYNAAEAGDSAGWYNDAWELITNVKIAQAAGVILSCSGAVKLQTSGQVLAGKQEIPLYAGFTVAGNNTNIDHDLQDLKLIGSEGWGADQIQVLGDDGVVTDEVYFWYNAGEAGDDAGWYNDAWEPIVEVSVEAGKALIFSCSGNVALEIPSQLD